MKKNPIVALFDNISDEELKLIIQEMVDDEAKGYVSDGYVRQYIKKVQKLTNSTTFSTDMLMVQMALYKQAAQRWIQ
jgi:hypothetical protein